MPHSGPNICWSRAGTHQPPTPTTTTTNGKEIKGCYTYVIVQMLTTPLSVAFRILNLWVKHRFSHDYICILLQTRYDLLIKNSVSTHIPKCSIHYVSLSKPYCMDFSGLIVIGAVNIIGILNDLVPIYTVKQAFLVSN